MWLLKGSRGALSPVQIVAVARCSHHSLPAEEAQLRRIRPVSIGLDPNVIDHRGKLCILNR